VIRASNHPEPGFFEGPPQASGSQQRDDIAPPPCDDPDEGADRLGRTAAEMDTGDTSGVRPSRAPQHARRDTLRDRLQARGLRRRPRGDARRRT
jgi:hypothetical protein